MIYQEWQGNFELSLLIAEKIETSTLLSHFFERMFDSSFRFSRYESETHTLYRGTAEEFDFHVSVLDYKVYRKVMKDYYLPILLNGASTFISLKFSHIQLSFILSYINVFAKDFKADFALVDDSLNPFVVRHNDAVFVITPIMHEGLRELIDQPHEIKDVSEFSHK